MENKPAPNCDLKSSKKATKALAGAGGSLGLAAFAGACATCCGGTLPLVALLSSAGLGAVAPFLSTLKLPFMGLAFLLGAFALRDAIRRGRSGIAAGAGVLMGATLVFGAWHFYSQSDCRTNSTISNVVSKLTPTSKRVIQQGVFALWPELGRAPTFQEIQARLGLESEKPVIEAFDELDQLGYRDVLYPGTQTIKWLWPFSSLDHGVQVTLQGTKTVHARCAIDALGMSAMFRKPAKITVLTPLDRIPLDLEVDGDKIVKADSSILVSHRPDDCDSMLFFSSQDEFERYLKASGKTNLNAYSLPQALERGIFSFGKGMTT